MPPQNYPSKDAQREYYDQWNTDFRAGDRVNSDPEIVQRASEVIECLRQASIKNAKVLEVGCGTGWFCESLQEFGTVVGVDLSPAAIEQARKRMPDASFEATDVVDHDFGGQKFDVIVCLETLFYVAEQEAFIKKLASLLTHDGLVIFTTINKFVYERRAEIEPPEAGQVRAWLSMAGTRRLLKNHFSILSLHTIGPEGHMGVLRIANSVRLSGILSHVIGQSRLTKFKEWLGLGAGVVIVAQHHRDQGRADS